MRQHGIEINGVFDTLVESRRRRPDVERGHSLRAVCARELAIELDKTEQTSDWARRPLSSWQLRYAARDASILLDLWRLWHAGGPSGR